MVRSPTPDGGALIEGLRVSCADDDGEDGPAVDVDGVWVGEMPEVPGAGVGMVVMPPRSDDGALVLFPDSSVGALVGNGTGVGAVVVRPVGTVVCSIGASVAGTAGEGLGVSGIEEVGITNTFLSSGSSLCLVKMA